MKIFFDVCQVSFSISLSLGVNGPFEYTSHPQKRSIGQYCLCHRSSFAYLWHLSKLICQGVVGLEVGESGVGGSLGVVGIRVGGSREWRGLGGGRGSTFDILLYAFDRPVVKTWLLHFILKEKDMMTLNRTSSVDHLFGMPGLRRSVHTIFFICSKLGSESTQS